MSKKKGETNLLAKEFELLIQDLEDSGIVVNKNVENIETDKIIVTFVSGKKEKRANRQKEPEREDGRVHWRQQNLSQTLL